MYSTPTYEAAVVNKGNCESLASSSLDVLETSVRNALEMTAAQSRYFKNLEDEREKIIRTLVWNDAGQSQGRINRVSSCCAYPRVIATKFDRPVLVVGRCKDRMCPRCSRHNAWQMSQRLEQIISRMNTRRLITLTLKHRNGDLKSQIDRLMLGWRKIRKTPTWTDHVDGGVYSLEVTYDDVNRTWHPHLHIIAEGTYFDQKVLSTLWKKVTGDSPVVDIRAIESVKRCSRYVSKYVTKPDEVAQWPMEILWEYMQAIKGRRLFHTFGCLHGVKVNEERDKVEQKVGFGYAAIGRMIDGLKEGHWECIELFEFLKFAPRPWRLAFGIADPPEPHGGDGDDEMDNARLDRLLWMATKRLSRDYVEPVIRKEKEPPPPTLFDDG